MAPETSSISYTQLAYPIPSGKIVQPHGTSSKSQLLRPSLLHPHISAPDCCLHWMTPFGVAHMHKVSLHIPTTLIMREYVVLAMAIKPKTLSNYGTSLFRFTQFFNALNIPEDLQMPAPEWLLSTIITTRGTSTVGAGTLKTWLLGLEL